MGSSLALAVLGCSHEPVLELGQARQMVVGGEYTGTEEQMVVRLFGSPPPGSTEITRACTGTLLAPNLVLSALHCLSALTADGSIDCTLDGELGDPPKGNLGSPIDPTHIAVSVGPDFTRTPSARGMQLISTRSTQICQNDLALIVLDTSLDMPIAPVRIDSRVQIGEKVTVVGYGLTDEQPPPGELTMRRWRAAVRVLAVELDGIEKSRPRTFALGESVCMGDSGGPALSEQGGVLGVYSTNLGGCAGSGARNFFTMLSGFAPLIRDAYAAAGATPWLEGEPAPGTVVAAPDDPDPGLDAGSLVLDGTPPDEPPPVTPAPSKRVDSGFCSTSPNPHSGFGAVATLGAALLGLTARRRRA
ncbi:MAG: trypsin-like serine protease [Deltaproteobacteria bacterium]